MFCVFCYARNIILFDLRETNLFILNFSYKYLTFYMVVECQIISVCEIYIMTFSIFQIYVFKFSTWYLYQQKHFVDLVHIQSPCTHLPISFLMTSWGNFLLNVIYTTNKQNLYTTCK